MVDDQEVGPHENNPKTALLLYRYFPLIGFSVALFIVFCMQWLYPRYSLDRIPGAKEFNDRLQEKSRRAEKIYLRNQELEKNNPIKTRLTEKVANTKFNFIGVRGGCFMMGSEDKDAFNDERPVHEVCVNSFYMGEHEVTQGQWYAIMWDTSRQYNQDNTHPVERVSWFDAQRFIVTLNQMTGKQYRLPTEAEWEYAARSGGKAEKWAGTNDEKTLGDYAWFGQTLALDIITRPVKQKKPNSLGLYDMSGNVWELCEDKFNYYIGTTVKLFNPLIISGNAISHVMRGGAWQGEPASVRNTVRGEIQNTKSSSNVGFRLVLDHVPISRQDRTVY